MTLYEFLKISSMFMWQWCILLLIMMFITPRDKDPGIAGAQAIIAF